MPALLGPGWAILVVVRQLRPDRRGLLTVGVAAAVVATHTTLPVGVAVDALFALVGTSDKGLDAWQKRLVVAVESWARENTELLADWGGLLPDWRERLPKALDSAAAATSVGSDRGSREVLEAALSEHFFTPLTKLGWAASQAAAAQLLDDLPRLLVAAADPASGVGGLLVSFDRGIEDVLDRLPPPVADRAIIETYLVAVIRELDHDAWTRTAGGEAISVSGLARKLTLHTTAATNPSTAADEAGSDADEFIGRCRRVVILGDPGAGKSWLARRTGMRAAEAALAALHSGARAETIETIEVPLFARCPPVVAAAAGDSADAWSALVTAAVMPMAHRFGPGPGAEAFLRRLRDRPGVYLVILDGLDEGDETAAATVFDRLVATAGRDLRIMVTCRPGSWRRQLPMTRTDPRDRVARLDPLGYPGDVERIVEHWLADRPEARDALLNLLRERSDLASAACTPLVCAMYCLVASWDGEIPDRRRLLYQKVVTRLLRGTWRQEEEADAETRRAARVALE
ncbi:MAG: hypothetical protein QOE57_1587, partial [Acidimicrobiaceae bacterium]|nr:hypothetical protein [Acidimicrobiaceae bacterium]